MCELHNEKRALAKKIQECDELAKYIKNLEQKCDNYELKIDERDSLIGRLKTKNIQYENDLTRLNYEYQKLKTTIKANNIIMNQQPYVAATTYNESSSPSVSQKSTATISLNVKEARSKPTQLPITRSSQPTTKMTENAAKYQSNSNLSNIINVETLNNPPSASSSTTSSPSKGVITSHVNIYCTNQSAATSTASASSASSSSKSPRSRSPLTMVVGGVGPALTGIYE